MRQQHGLFRAEDLGRLGHEVDAAEDDQVRRGAARLHREPERIAGEIGDVLDLGDLVVVGEDDCVLLLTQAVDLGGQLRVRQVGVVVVSGDAGGFDLAHDSTLAPGSVVISSVPCGNTRQNSLRMSPAIAALLLDPW